jgi:cell division protein FtsI/penicillin-binding protein 2
VPSASPVSGPPALAVPGVTAEPEAAVTPGGPPAAPVPPASSAAPVPAASATAPAPAQRPLRRPGSTPPPGTPPRGRASRHRKPPEHRSPLKSRKLRFAAALVVLAGLLAAGFADGFGTEASAEGTVQAFLLDWQQGHYTQAASLTDGAPDQVRTQLAAAYTDLDASNAFFALSRITQHGDTAVANYKATVDLAQAGKQWTYAGQFGLTARDGHWVVNWAPSVVNPRLSAGDRLAVVTSFSPRAGVEDLDGQSLLAKSSDYQVGVYPGKLKNPAATAAAFSTLTGLDSQQVLGQIQAAPPGSFLSLLTLGPSQYGALWPKLAKVAGLSYQQQSERLFDSSAQEVVGQVGTENATELREEGAAYQPGMTVGLTGLEQAYQDDLIGTPTTSVVVVNQAGRTVGVLWSSHDGRPGTPVRTTISGTAQAAATAALAGQSNSAEIVAVDTASGAIRATASREAAGVALPSGGVLDAKVKPGMAFSIVSAAALLASGVGANHALPCEPVADVGGVTFTYQPDASDTATLASDFASGCGTAFANMSRTLTAQQLATAERGFGIGANWGMRLPGFSGSAQSVTGEAGRAAQATGSGGVLVSPLTMAGIAAEVASGAGHTPTLTASDSSSSFAAPLSSTQLDALRQLMRLAVTKGSAKAANVSGTPVYGQAGVVQSGKHSYLSWFVGYRGNLAVAVLETGTSASSAAAALAGSFLKSAG